MWRLAITHFQYQDLGSNKENVHWSICRVPYLSTLCIYSRFRSKTIEGRRCSINSVTCCFSKYKEGCRQVFQKAESCYQMCLWKGYRSAFWFKLCRCISDYSFVTWIRLYRDESTCWREGGKISLYVFRPRSLVFAFCTSKAKKKKKDVRSSRWWWDSEKEGKETIKSSKGFLGKGQPI